MSKNLRSPITSHVLDLSKGKPAKGIRVNLEMWRSGKWQALGTGVTNQEGRLESLLELGSRAQVGKYRLCFNLETYLGKLSFFPETTIVFQISKPEQHHHIPLLLSPYGYSTYKGS